MQARQKPESVLCSVLGGSCSRRGNQRDVPDEDEMNTSVYVPASVRKVLLQSADPIHLFSFWPITRILCTPPFCSLQSSGCSSCKPNKYVASALFFLENTPGGSTCGDLRSGSSHTNMTGSSCTCGKKRKHAMLLTRRLPHCNRSRSHALKLAELSVSHMSYTQQVGDLAAASTSTYLYFELCNKSVAQSIESGAKQVYQ